ncbi:MAG TPA: Rieske 2Fe-2S domain-containing protein [Gemmata sp.]
MTATTARVPLCTLDDLPVGLGRAFEIGGRALAVFRGRAGEVFAVDGKCPHKGGPLADGMLIGSQIVCPLHGFRFDGGTGGCDQEGACAVGAYPVEVSAGQVFVTVPLS